MKDITQRFKIRSESGQVYDALVLQERADQTNLHDTRQRFTYGLEEYQLADGRNLNYIDDDTFELIATGEQLRRV